MPKAPQTRLEQPTFRSWMLWSCTTCQSCWYHWCHLEWDSWELSASFHFIIFYLIQLGSKLFKIEKNPLVQQSTSTQYNIYTSSARTSRGWKFQRKKNYKSKKEFAYRMRARRPTSAMPKPFLSCERAFCRSMVVMFGALKWSVLMSWCLLRGQVMWWSRHLMRCDGLCCVMSRDAMRCHGDELYYSSTSLYYKVLLQYYPVLQSTTPVVPCTTKYYSSTTKYYSRTNLYYKVLLCTTKYYSSTTLYYKVLLQYYPVLQSTTPVLLCTTKYYSNTTLHYKYYSVLL